MKHEMEILVNDVFGVHSMEEPTFGEGERNPKVRESSKFGENTKFYQLVKVKETKKMIYVLGLGYNKIHVCPNNYILYVNRYVKYESMSKVCYIYCDDEDRDEEEERETLF